MCFGMDGHVGVIRESRQEMKLFGKDFFGADMGVLSFKEN